VANNRAPTVKKGAKKTKNTHRMQHRRVRYRSGLVGRINVLEKLRKSKGLSPRLEVKLTKLYRLYDGNNTK
jgi:hypothetical protein